MASGNTPDMNASEVMRIGRTRCRVGMHHRLDQVHAMVEVLLGEFHDEDGALGREADRDQQADLEIRVIGESARQRRDDRAEHAQRHDQQHGRRDRPALVQRREAQEHDRPATTHTACGACEPDAFSS